MNKTMTLQNWKTSRPIMTIKENEIDPKLLAAVTEILNLQRKGVITSFEMFEKLIHVRNEYEKELATMTFEAIFDLVVDK
jgi:hypothetical protein